MVACQQRRVALESIEFATISSARTSAERESNRIDDRKLFSVDLRNSICSIARILFDSNLHTGVFDCGDQLGVVLVASKRNAGSCQFGCDHCTYDDHTDVVH